MTVTRLLHSGATSFGTVYSSEGSNPSVLLKSVTGLNRQNCPSNKSLGKGEAGGKKWSVGGKCGLAHNHPQYWHQHARDVKESVNLRTLQTVAATYSQSVKTQTKEAGGVHQNPIPRSTPTANVDTYGASPEAKL